MKLCRHSAAVEQRRGQAPLLRCAGQRREVQLQLVQHQVRIGVVEQQVQVRIELRDARARAGHEAAHADDERPRRRAWLL